ncbi:hypothetical protein MPNT_10176 [Candidatus Methylacidithermus pantelleriae]|uniref:Uncharacterized protein n=1 Tax=Candidatus Methylacidithermus pantelleriae TaxID=2744239 RepID=A0A8J2BJB1_9BACT|nr:hypothetical protein MPNT_10176 [Candidatus Methylacidithermus pantelleriae]
MRAAFLTLTSEELSRLTTCALWAGGSRVFLLDGGFCFAQVGQLILPS